MYDEKITYNKQYKKQGSDKNYTFATNLFCEIYFRNSLLIS